MEIASDAVPNGVILNFNIKHQVTEKLRRRPSNLVLFLVGLTHVGGEFKKLTS